MNTLGELITTLQDLAGEHGNDADVRIAAIGYRTNMEYVIEDIVAVEIRDERDDPEDDGQMYLYLVQSDRNEYLPSSARKAILGED